MLSAGSDRWKTLRRDLERVLDLDEDATHGGRDKAEELSPEARDLLAQDTSLWDEVADFTSRKLTVNIDGRIGQQIGAYIITAALGQGGMGAVYRAQRADGQFEKEVAIKVLKRGTDTEEVLRRFRDERQILARLEHPAITRILDAGTMPDGLPYFVMEFAEGLTLLDASDARKLRQDEQLELFLEICAGVEFAHTHGVIHRDLKPGNIIVKGDGRPKLVDFGIAKLFERSAGDDSKTLPAHQRLSALYAAPEQKKGELSTPQTDIYSLGIILGQLLTKTASWTGGKEPGKIDGALLKIIHRATEIEPERRYSSVAEFSGALRGYLSRPREGIANPSGDSKRRITARTTVFIALAAMLFLGLGAFAVYRWRHRPPGPTDIKSLAVIPFKVLGEETSKFNGLGMADAVIGRLSRLDQVAVLPTAAVGRVAPDQSGSAGRELHVDALLTGTIQRSGDRIRVTVQLVRVNDSKVIWSDVFDQTFTDIFAIQDSISQNVANSLVRNLSASEREQLRKRFTASAPAYEAYTRGFAAYSSRSKEGLDAAIRDFQQATVLDPKYALAYAVMADAYYLQGYYRFKSRMEVNPLAKAAVEKALSLDDSLAEAHVAWAMLQFELDGSGNSSVQSLQRALQLNPNLAVAHQRYAWQLCILGRLEEAVTEMSRAQQLDPLSPTQNSALGTLLLYARRFPESLGYERRAVELNPTEPSLQNNLALAYLVAGNYPQAVEAAKKVLELDPSQEGSAFAIMAVAQIKENDHDGAEMTLARIRKLADADKIGPFDLAVIAAAQGNKDEAFRQLKIAFDQRSLGPGSLRYEPLLDPLRSDPRFDSLLNAVKAQWQSSQH